MRATSPEYEERYRRNAMGTSLPSSSAALDHEPVLRQSAPSPSLEAEVVCRFDKPARRTAPSFSEERVRRSVPSLESKAATRYENIKSVPRRTSKPYASHTASASKETAGPPAKSYGMSYAQRRSALCDPRFTNFPTPCAESKEECRHFKDSLQSAKSGLAAAHLAGAGCGGSASLAAAARSAQEIPVKAAPPTHREAAAVTAAAVASQRQRRQVEVASPPASARQTLPLAESGPSSARSQDTPSQPRHRHQSPRAAGLPAHFVSMEGTPKTLRQHMVEGSLREVAARTARADRTFGGS